MAESESCAVRHTKAKTVYGGIHARRLDWVLQKNIQGNHLLFKGLRVHRRSYCEME